MKDKATRRPSDQTTELLFRWMNLYPMPLWLAMMFAPKHPVTQRMARSSTVLGLAAVNYILALALALRNPEPTEQRPDFTSLEGVRALLSTRGGAAAGWAHMLALDLFSGAWVYRESEKLGAPAWARVGSLFFTLMSGPFGLLLFLVWRIVGGKQGEALDEAV